MIGKWHLGVNKNECGCKKRENDIFATGEEEIGKCERMFGWRCFWNWSRYESGMPFICSPPVVEEEEKKEVSILKPPPPFNSKTKVTDGLELCSDCTFQNGYFFFFFLFFFLFLFLFLFLSFLNLT